MNVISILNILIFIVPLLWLAAILIYWLKSREVKLNWVKYGIFTTILFLIISASYSTTATYNLWKADPVSRYLLPPYNAAYFYQYAFFHYWQACAIIIAISFVWAFMLWIMSRYSQGRLLGKADVYLGFLAALAAGWPKFIFFVAIFFGLMLGQQIIGTLIFKKSEAAPVAPYLAASAIIVLIAGEFLINKLNLGVLRI